jgi:hypothetical protein
MKPLHLTLHARKRSEQRGISELQIQLISMFGQDHYQTGGYTLSYIPRKRLLQLREAIDRLDAIALVKTPGEAVATVMHVDRRFGRTEYVS